MAKASTPTEVAEAAALLREVLALVEAGDLEASSPRAIALVRRVEGAAAALEAVANNG